MQMSDGQVMTCHANDCSYNCELECCAPDITVGDQHPMCDTYTHSDVSETTHEASVSRCGVTQCYFNDSQMCDAQGITLMHHATHVDCSTFRNK